MATPTWFITHTHLDHAACLPVFVARRRMMRMEPPTIYVPAEALDDIKRLLLVWQRLDRIEQRLQELSSKLAELGRHEVSE